ncbi:hypothetical protein V5T82_03820 [Magnetovibrio sp. PR-2]|uniref:hypothetical protein n=1 Tax=Magnetovibrio sp. PR-2 TaxID=3120356 RepID=UPI002FCE29DF
MKILTENWKAWGLVLLCVAAPIGVFVIGKGGLVAFSVCDISYQYTCYSGASGAQKAAEAAGRYTWLSSVFIMAAICLLAVVYFVIRIVSRKSWSLFLTTHAIVLAGVCGLLYAHAVIGEQKTFQCVSNELFHNTIGSTELMKKLSSILYDSPLTLYDLVSYVEYIVIIAGFAISVGVAFLTFEQNDKRKYDLDVIKSNILELRSYLYLGALGLVSGLMSLRNFFYWPQHFVTERPKGEVAESAMRAEYLAHVDAVVLYQSMVYVVLLGVMFGIPYVIFIARARAIAREELVKMKQPDTLSAIRGWLDKKEFKISLPEQMGQLVAILSPVLMGSASSILPGIVG